MTDKKEEKNAAVIKDGDSAEGETKTLRCPECGKNHSFYVTTKISQDIDVLVDGECEVIAAVPEDVKWKDADPTKCCKCGYKGQFKDFVVKEEKKIERINSDNNIISVII